MSLASRRNGRADLEKDRRRGAWRFGRLGEALCAWLLRLKGYQVIARDVARQVQEELTYPGQIRVTVIRESRATEFAR